jgi:16S rRNA (uracil1498-N3)-methyltransferase
MFAQGVSWRHARRLCKAGELVQELKRRRGSGIAVRQWKCVHRLFVPSSDLNAVEGGGTLKLPSEEQQHVRSRRLVDGTRVELFDGTGRLAAGQLAGRGRTVESLHWLPEETDVNRSTLLRPSVTVSCLVATPKSAHRADWMVEKLTELGVSAYRHLTCRRVEIDPPQVEKRAAARWQHVSIAASKQSLRRTLLDCGTAGAETATSWLSQWFPSPIVELERLILLLRNMQSENVVFLLAKPEAKRTLSAWRTEHWPLLSNREPMSPPRQVVGIVGPEGGFMGDEEDALLQAGVVGVSLGPQRLRTETAAVAFAAALLIG